MQICVVPLKAATAVVAGFDAAAGGAFAAPGGRAGRHWGDKTHRHWCYHESPEHNLIRINRDVCRSLVAGAEVMINFSLITQL